MRGRSSRTALVKRPPNSKPRYSRSGCGRQRTIVALFTVPLTSSFSVQFGPYVPTLPQRPALPGGFAFPSAGLDPPTGSHVWGTFSVNGTEAVGFQVSDQNDNVVYSDNSTQGSFSFTASNPPYHVLSRPNRFRIGLRVGSLLFPILFF